MPLDFKYVVAPMVQQSELAWRMMMRAHRATLCYTPMINGNIFIRDETYRQQELDFHELDRPLIVQFASNQPEVFMNCGKIVESRCDGIDLNLGCPQNIARRGYYGSFLQDDWQLIHNMIKLASTQLSIPISAKIRIFESSKKSLEYAQMLEHSGCSMICVHGRTRDQKSQNTGIADWDTIKLIKESISIPLISNGNIQYHSDIEKCLNYTCADGIMVAEGCLYNPYIFENRNISAFDAAIEYITYAKMYAAHPHSWRCHLFKILLHVFNVFPEYREKLGVVKDLESAEALVKKLFLASQCHQNITSSSLDLPYWMCQPYIRKIPSILNIEATTESK